MNDFFRREMLNKVECTSCEKSIRQVDTIFIEKKANVLVCFEGRSTEC